MAESMAMEEAGPGKISVCIITGNERRHIRRCLESVKWADEIVVVDSFSTDGTAQIVDEYTPRRYLHRWIGYIGQKSVAKSLARCEWILFVDADEAVSDQLHAEIADRFSRGIPDDVNGFDFPRQVWFLNRWIRHGDWYPDTKLRLFRRTRGACAGQEPHEKVVVAGRVEHLRSPLYTTRTTASTIRSTRSTGFRRSARTATISTTRLRACSSASSHMRLFASSAAT